MLFSFSQVAKLLLIEPNAMKIPKAGATKIFRQYYTHVTASDIGIYTKESEDFIQHWINKSIKYWPVTQVNMKSNLNQRG